MREKGHCAVKDNSEALCIVQERKGRGMDSTVRCTRSGTTHILSLVIGCSSELVVCLGHRQASPGQDTLHETVKDFQQNLTVLK
ncbi:hypothetical protein RRG08_031426 [Elysia crispata]|uniref:Uncharacterized protein n=1 Tax=Elysia crispata TaxID=231223 RepID=A0AAE0ZMW8_9GAST|nr:hypothetical protein RRG08_031426 [Elysia crispata]